MQTIRIENRTIFRILLSLAAFLLLIKIIIVLQTVLLWVAGAFFLALALNPAVSWLAQFLPRRSRGLSIFLVLLVFFLVGIFLILSFLPPLISQTQQLVNSIPGAVRKIQNLQGPVGEAARHYDLVQRVSQASGNAFSYLSTATGSALSVLKSVFSGFAAGLTIFTLTFFMLLEAPIWVRNFWALSPAHNRREHQKLAHQMYRAVTGYVNGNFLTSAIAAVTSMIVMMLVGVPYSIPLGLLVGFLDLMPLVGATLAAAVVVVVALFHSFTSAAIMSIYFLIYQQVEINVLQPLVYGKSTELSPLVVTVAIIIGTTLAGIFGALVAIPVAACIKIILVHFYGNQLEDPADTVAAVKTRAPKKRS